VNDRLLKKIDWNPTRINSLTASTPSAIRTPVHYASDRECLEKISPTVGKVELAEVTFAWIKNTLELRELKVSENLRGEIENNRTLEIVGEPEPIGFDADGNLPASVFEEHPVGVS